MPPTTSARGTWGIRLLIRFFTLALAILVYWLLGFLVHDIESARGPEYPALEKQYVDQALTAKRDTLGQQIADLERETAAKRSQQQLVSDSSQNLQRTVGQLLDLQRLSLEKSVSLSDADKSNLSVSLNGFLESQRRYQQLNTEMSDLTARQQTLAEERRRLEQQITKQQEPAHQAFAKLTEAHRVRLALCQLAILIPLLLVAAYLLLRRRNSPHFLLFLAFGGATLVKVALVIHKYFPSKLFKYVLLLALLGVVGRLLVHLIRTVAAPKLDWLLRQYREAYERFLCPVCEYPIRTGPRRFLYWTRRTVHKVLPPAEGTPPALTPYTCPACGTVLFEACPACGQTRHALLSHCEHCGARKELAQVP